MLAPGEFLLLPVQQDQFDALAGRDTEPNLPVLAARETVLTPVAAPAPQPEERPSFLLILLRALGAIHS